MNSYNPNPYRSPSGSVPRGRDNLNSGYRYNQNSQNSNTRSLENKPFSTFSQRNSNSNERRRFYKEDMTQQETENQLKNFQFL